MRFGWNMWAWARLHAAAARRNTFYYRFAHTPAGQQGATHGAEMAYVFDHLDLYDAPWTQSDRRLAQTMIAYWTNFARTGDPNGAGLPDWPEFERPNERVLQLNGAYVRATAAPNAANLAAIDRLYGTVRVLLKYGVFIAASVVLLVLAMMSWLVVRLLRRRKMASAPAA
jgi:para-nitrobenzyl esterase